MFTFESFKIIGEKPFNPSHINVIWLSFVLIEKNFSLSLSLSLSLYIYIYIYIYIYMQSTISKKKIFPLPNANDHIQERVRSNYKEIFPLPKANDHF